MDFWNLQDATGLGVPWSLERAGRLAGTSNGCGAGTVLGLSSEEVSLPPQVPWWAILVRGLCYEAICPTIRTKL